MKQIVILSAYGFAWENPRAAVTACGFIQALNDRDWQENVDFSVEIYHAPRLRDHHEFLEQRLCSPVDLVYAGSSSLMGVARCVMRELGSPVLPLVYWGAHIFDQNRYVNPYPTDPNVCGVLLNMPLYHTHRQFRLLPAMFPLLTSVYCPFSTESAFCVSTVKENYANAVKALGDDCWFESRSNFGGFPGLGRLADVFGLTLYEHPCTSAATTEAAVRRIRYVPPRTFSEATAVVIVGLDCFHIPGAVEAVVRATSESVLPLIGLNFSQFESADGPLALFANDLYHASYLTGNLASAILLGKPPLELGNIHQDHFAFRLNRASAKRCGYELPLSALHHIEKQFEIQTLEATASIT